MVDLKRAWQLTQDWQGCHVLVVGDVMLDRTTRVKPVGQSAEQGDAMVYRTLSTIEVPGGAGNAAMNLAAMGAKPTLVAATGLNDEGGRKLNYLLAKGGVIPKLVGDATACTTIKHRVEGERGMLFRLDQDMAEVHGLNGIQLADAIRSQLHGTNYHGLLLSDYTKGVFSTPQVREVLSQHHVPHSVLDPRRGLLARSVPVDAVTPNIKETMSIGGFHRLRFFLIPDLEVVVETRGLEGARIYHHNTLTATDVGTVPVAGASVCGAGDTFAAALLLGRMAGGDWLHSTLVANAAARAAVLNPGTYAVTAQDIRSQLEAVCAAQQ